MEDDRSNRMAYRFPVFACGVFTAAAGAAALAGWILHIPLLTKLGGEFIPMAPNTALLFTIFGTAVMAHTVAPGSRAARRMCMAAGASGVVIGAILSVLSVNNIHLDIERMGLSAGGKLHGIPVGHMSFVTALFFTAAGLCLLGLMFAAPDRRRPAQTAYYAALLFIIINSVFLIAYVLGDPLLYGGRFIPPALPTVLAFTAIGAALAAMAVPKRRPPEPSPGALDFYRLALVFVLLSAGIVAVGFYSFRNYETKYVEDTKLRLAIIADLKAGQLQEWRKERLSDASLFYGNDDFSMWVRRYFENPEDEENRERLQIWMREARISFRYNRVCLHDARGVEHLSVPEGEIHTANQFSKSFSKVMREGKPEFVDFYRDEHDGRVYLSVLVPIIDRDKSAGIIGVLAFRIDPDKFLYPIITRWPGPSRTAETLIVRRDGNFALGLNELRFKKNTALRFRESLKEKNFPAVKAVLGRETVEEGIDYRGVRVLAATRRIPDSPWFMVAREDIAEVYEPLRERLWITVVFMAALLIGAGAGAGMVWRRQKLEFFREKLDAAQRLRDSETRMELAIKGGDLGTWDWNILTGEVINNDRWAEMAGYKLDETKQKVEDWEFLTHPDDMPLVHKALDDHIEGRAPFYEIEHRMRHKNGKWIWVLDRGCVIERDAIGRPVRMAGTHIDITGRKLAEQRIIHLNRVLRAIRDVNQLTVRERDPKKLIQEACDLMVENRGYLSAVIILTDENRKPLDWAQAGLTGIQERINESMSAGALPPCCAGADTTDGIYHIKLVDRAAVCAGCFSSVEYADSEALCIRLNHEQRNYGYISASLDKSIGSMDAEEESLFTEMAGDIAFALYTQETESAMRLAEKERDRMQGELLQARKMEAVGRLAGGIAHDFNNMLTVINNYAAMALGTLVPDDPLRKDMEDILAAGEKAAQLTTRLLAFSRRQILEPVILNVSKTVKGMETMIQRIIGEDIDLVFYHEENAGKIKADPGQIEQILMNLAVNARDAMPRGGSLTIETANVSFDEDCAARHQDAAPGDYVMLSVSDTGIGMDEATIANIFDPFFTTKGPGMGTGLGLSTVYGIVKQSGGHIWVYSEPGKGTTIKVHFPREFGEADAEAKKPKIPGLAAGTETILVVEDEQGVRDIVKRVLVSAGYQVHTAANMDETMALFENLKGKIHLLITDVVMPGKSGREIAEQLQKTNPELKVLYMSGYTENAIVHHGVLDHGLHFLSKPFTVQALAQKVRDVLDA